MKKTDEEKIAEYKKFFKDFCSELTKRNRGYTFEFVFDNYSSVFNKPEYCYSAKIHCIKHNSTMAVRTLYKDDHINSTKTELGTLRSLFRKIFSGRTLFAYSYKDNPSHSYIGDMCDESTVSHMLTMKFEKCRSLAEANIRLTLLGFEFND